MNYDGLYIKLISINVYQVYRNGEPAANLYFGSRKRGEDWILERKEIHLPYPLFTEKKDLVIKNYKNETIRQT